MKQSTAPSMLSTLELQIIKDFMQLLEPFKSTTTIFSGKMYITGSQVIPIIHTLQNQLELELELSIPSSEVGCHIKKVLIQEFQARFRNIENTSLIAIATILDPRFKKFHFSDKIACCFTINKITHMLNTINKENVNKQQKNIVKSDSINGKESESNFWSFYETLIQKSKNFTSNSTDNEMQTSNTILVRYLLISLNVH